MVSKARSKKKQKERIWKSLPHDGRVREARKLGEYPIVIAEGKTLKELEGYIGELIARKSYFLVYKTVRGLGLRRNFLHDEVDVEYGQFCRKFTETPKWGVRILERSSSGINRTGNYSEYKESLDNILSPRREKL